MSSSLEVLPCNHRAMPLSFPSELYDRPPSGSVKQINTEPTSASANSSIVLALNSPELHSLQILAAVIQCCHSLIEGSGSCSSPQSLPLCSRLNHKWALRNMPRNMSPSCCCPHLLPLKVGGHKYGSFPLAVHVQFEGEFVFACLLILL